MIDTYGVLEDVVRDSYTGSNAQVGTASFGNISKKISLKKSASRNTSRWHISNLLIYRSS